MMTGKKELQLSISSKVRRGQCRKKLEFERSHLIQVLFQETMHYALVLAITIAPLRRRSWRRNTSSPSSRAQKRWSRLLACWCDWVSSLNVIVQVLNKSQSSQLKGLEALHNAEASEVMKRLEQESKVTFLQGISLLHFWLPWPDIYDIVQRTLYKNQIPE